MKVETVVCRESHPHWGRDRWTVFAILDGELTSWGCSHLHHSPEVAERCLGRLRRDVTAWFAHEDVTVELITEASKRDDALYETSYGHRPGGTTLRRFRKPYTEVMPIGDPA